MTADAVKREVSRLREEVAHTVSNPLEVDDEISYLFAVLNQ